MIVIAMLMLAMVLVISTAQQPSAPAPSSSTGVVTPESSTGSAATLDQCRNGGVGATPVPCNPTTNNPLGWVNGNAQGQQAHWREGDSISYRVIITGLAPNTAGNTLLFNWSTVHGSKHALDYITSYDRTETTSLIPSQFYANHNNPCSDVLSTANCNPPSPTTFFPIPDPIAAGVLTNCGGSSGTFKGTIPTGSNMELKGYGAPGTLITAVAYQSVQDPSGTGQCSTGFQVTFTSGSGSTVVLAWGGHIASQADWGLGNSASFISGSPYHMFLDSLNGASTGAQDRALATSAIFFTPSIFTKIKNAATNTVIANGSMVPLGTSVYDNATLVNASFNAGGTVYYDFFTNFYCSGTPSTNESVTVVNGKVPGSPVHGPLSAGSYSFQAFYGGDTSTNNFAAKGACEPFKVGTNPTTTYTRLVLDGSGVMANGTAVALGSSVHDTAFVGPQVGSIPITGTVTYHFYTNGTCSAPSSNEVVTISGGIVPASSSHGPLATGSYSFNATYSGDANYGKSDSVCEPFSVGKASTTIFTNLIVGTNTPLANGSTIALGSSVHDTSTVTGQVGGFAITGTVTYSFFLNATCSAPAFKTFTVSVGQPSGTVGPLAAGDYSFSAEYSGDGNYSGSSSTCEPFHVAKGPTTIFTNLFNASDQPLANGSTIALGTSVYDTSTVTGQVNGFAITGTVTFRFFLNGTCSAPAFKTWSVPLGDPSGTVGPLAAGSYSFNASYSGGSNYNVSYSSCEPFAVGKASTGIFTNLIQGTDTPLANGSTIALGSLVHDTSTVTGQVGNFAITGTVTYSFFLNGTCSAPAFATWTVPVGDPSGTVGPLAAGDYSFNAVYSGDGNYTGSSSACEPFAVGLASTTIFTNLVLGASTPLANDSTVALGSFVHDTSTVTGQVGSFAITGTVTYRFFLNGTCSAPAFATWTVPVGDPSGPVGPLAAGDYSFNASYSGNKNYKPAYSTCEPFHVAKGPTTIFTNLVQGTNTPLANGSTIALGSLVHDTSTVTGQVNSFLITGTVTYRFFTNGTCSAPAFATFPVAVGDPSGSVGPLPAGDYSFNASYSGNGNYNASDSACEPFSVGKASTTIFTNLIVGTNTPLANGSTIALGSSVHDTSTVTGQVGSFEITGTVTYRFFTNGTCSPLPFATWTGSLGDPSGIVGPLAAGSYSFNASYAGDENYNPSYSACEPFSVAKGPTTIFTNLVLGADTPLANESAVGLGSFVHDTSTVTGQVNSFLITGTVTYRFFTNGTCSAPAFATFTVSVGSDSGAVGPLAPGDYSFNASYSGNGNYNASYSACEPFSVAKGPTTIFTNLFNATDVPVANGSDIVLGSSVHDTSTVTGEVDSFPITGTVTYRFFTNGTCDAPALTTWTVPVGDPSGSVGPLPAGDYSFNASYSGDANYSGSFSDCEPFTVVQFPVPPTVSTQVFVTGTSGPDVQGTNLAPGTSVHDTSTLTAPTGSSGVIAPSGTMTYHFYADGACGAAHEITSLNGNTWPYQVSVTAFGSQSPSQETGALGTGSYSFQAVYSGDSDYQGAASPCEPFMVSIPPSVTDTTFCPVTQFRLIFIQKTATTYTLAASNPGQFYSNVFATLASPGSLSVTIKIPYPFVTQGAVPIQVFYNQPMPTCGSTVPSTNVNSEFSISPTSVTLGSYGGSPTMGVTTTGVTFTSTGTLPAGLYWFAIHLDYGLKGQTFSKVDQGSGLCVNPPNTLGACAAGTPSYNFIGNPQPYAFSNTLSGSNPVTSTNIFNKDPGLAGIVTDSLGTPVAGAKVTVTGGGISATTTTDQNGYYSFAFKSSGKTVTFTVTATFTYNSVAYTASGSVTMQLNTIAVVNLSFSGLVL